MKEEKKQKKPLKTIIKQNIFGFIIGGLIFGIAGVSAATYYASSDVSYDNSSSGMSATDVQSAIDELYNECSTSATSGRIVYSWNTTEIILGESTINELESTKTAKPYYDSASAVMSASGYTVFNKYTVVDDVITEGYSCTTLGILSTPICVQGGNSEYYNYQNSPGNWSILYALKSSSAFTGAGGSCHFASSNSACYVGDFTLNAFSVGHVGAGGSSAGAACNVRGNGIANCSE